jgi:hypothetical protein
MILEETIISPTPPVGLYEGRVHENQLRVSKRVSRRIRSVLDFPHEIQLNHLFRVMIQSSTCRLHSRLPLCSALSLPQCGGEDEIKRGSDEISLHLRNELLVSDPVSLIGADQFSHLKRVSRGGVDSAVPRLGWDESRHRRWPWRWP